MSRVGVALGLTLVLAGAAGGIWLLKERPVPIARIQQRAAQYDGREVKVRGAVTSAFDVLGVGYYSLRDNSGELPVLTTLGAPPAGSQVTVRGRVVKALQIQDHSVVGLQEIDKDL